ncbi:MAG TPA: peptidylprolyl isomerase [Chitinophagaceae bacterium]|nr:peptidylprolyl isomerase [Chitinophagaceae bacterium]
MFKLITAVCCFTFISITATTQTLFTYGRDTVTVAQFLQAYQKNNTGPKTAKAVQEYLDLYIASRLKIKAAKEQQLDTLPQIVADLQTLRSQIMGPYLTDDEAVNKLVAEAFTRSQKDIHIAHIFISLKDLTSAEEEAAEKKANEVAALIKKSEQDRKTTFSKIAQEYSDDPSVKENGGDLGWITVFSLPYELENLAYSTPVGKTSAVYRSKGGFHIFKNLGERKALGRMKAAQILLAFPPAAAENDKVATKKLADSIYNRLLKGGDFATLATAFSNDVVSAAAGGSIPEFGVGQYDALFENIVFTNLKDDTISKPFLTAYGYHIVKRIARVPVPAGKSDVKGMEALREKVEGDERINTTKDALATKILNSVSFRKEAFKPEDLWAFSDSVLDYKVTGKPQALKNESPLFKIGDQTITVVNWVVYAQTFRYKSDGSGLKPYAQVWDEFVKASALEYYKAHLENYNTAFRNQLAEFSEGNLFFEAMQRKVWTPAQSDSAALQTYYEGNRSKYTWNKSADAIIFYATDAAAAKSLLMELKKNPANWKASVAATAEKVTADSGRFELSQIPNALKGEVKKGMITEPLLNNGDNTTSFAYILAVHNNPTARSFTEAKSLVINDYQAALEKAWVAELKKKYPVVINEKAVATLVTKK